MEEKMYNKSSCLWMLLLSFQPFFAKKILLRFYNSIRIVKHLHIYTVTIDFFFLINMEC